jgi:hypothetical protein
VAKTKQSPPKDDAEQSRLFIKKARELGADRETEGDALMERLARKKPEPHEKKKRRSTR